MRSNDEEGQDDGEVPDDSEPGNDYYFFNAIVLTSAIILSVTVIVYRVQRINFTSYLIGICGSLTVLIIFGYWMFNDKLPDNALPNCVILSAFCILMCCYLVGDTCFLIRGYS